MVAERREPTHNGRERAVLVGVERPGQQGTLDERLAELVELADTAGCDAVAEVRQNRDRPDPRTYVGKGKVDEVKAAVEEHEADVVIFDTDLSPAQARTLENALERNVVDRTQLILDIFARRAKTQLARWQVELAQLEYELPRFRHMWTHLSRIEGGVGVGGRGPGETQIEIDRRRARDRIARLKERLAEAERQKEVSSAARGELFTCALVGYTNVGKSTLMNALAGAGVRTENRLFATLDATTRRIDVDGEPLLLTDTVGFIRDLPHGLVASFHATLAEVRDADLLLHVIDITSPELEEHLAAVRGVLDEIGVQDKAMLRVFNKIDALPAELDAAAIADRYGGGVLVSARTGAGLDDLQHRLAQAARERFGQVTLRVPYADGRTTAYIEANAKVLDRQYVDDGVVFTALLSPEDAGRLAAFVVGGGG